MPMIEIDAPPVLARVRELIEELGAERDSTAYGHQMYTLGWIGALHCQGLIRDTTEQQLADELSAAINARAAAQG